MSYAEDVARFQQQALQRQQADYERQVQAMRQQKAQEDYQVDCNQAVHGREQALLRRQEIEQQAACTNDLDERAQLMNDWHYHDGEYQVCDNEVRRLTPPQVNPTVQRYAHKDAAFCQREGQNGLATMPRAHAYL